MEAKTTVSPVPAFVIGLEGIPERVPVSEIRSRRCVQRCSASLSVRCVSCQQRDGSPHAGVVLPVWKITAVFTRQRGFVQNPEREPKGVLAP